METSTCPRRHVIDNPWIPSALELYRMTGGEPGVAGLSLSSIAVDSIEVVSAGRSWRESERIEQLSKKR